MRVRPATAIRLGSALALLALAFCVLWPAAHGSFVFDDKAYVSRNPLVLAPDGLVRFWTTAEPLDYWPLSFSAFWAEWRLFGADPYGYHLVAMGLHGVVAVLLWRLVVRLKVLPEWLAWAAAALYCLHPVNVETGAWIFQTRTTLATALGLGAGLLYLGYVERGGRWRYGAALGLFTLGMLAKSSVVTLPLAGMIGLLAWTVPRWRVGAPTPPRSSWKGLLPFLGVAAALALVDLRVTRLHPIESDAVRDDGLLSRAFGAARAVWFYLGKDFYPSHLDVVYPKWHLGIDTAAQVVPAAAMVAALGLLWAFRRTWTARVTALALAVFAALLLPCLGFVNISFMRHTYVSDHWQYPAIAVPLVWLLAVASRHLKRPGWWLAVPLGCVLVTFGILSWHRAGDFTDEATFWRAALADNPQSRLARLTLATLEDQAGNVAEAKAAYWQLISEGPESKADLPLVAGAHYNLGAMLAEHGNPDEAVIQYREAAAQLRVPEIQENLAALLDRLGRYPEAVAAWREAIELAPNAALAHAGLGQTLTRAGDREGAAKELAEAVRLEPRTPGYRSDLGLVLLSLGKHDDAAAQLAEALRLAPTDPAVVVANCRLLLADGKKEEALALAEKARRQAQAAGREAEAQQLGSVIRDLGGR